MISASVGVYEVHLVMLAYSHKNRLDLIGQLIRKAEVLWSGQRYDVVLGSAHPVYTPDLTCENACCLLLYEVDQLAMVEESPISGTATRIVV